MSIPTRKMYRILNDKYENEDLNKAMKKNVNTYLQKTIKTPRTSTEFQISV